VTREETLAVLQSGELEQLIGRPETLEVEFKGEPYQLDRESQKFELAKDVSAMANAAGGVIIIGAQTERGTEVAVDVVARLRLLAQGLVNEQQYETIISDRVYPRLREVHVQFYPSKDDAARGVVAIDVPPQDDIDKHFLVQRPIEEGADSTPGWLVGICVRSVGHVEGRRIGEIHTLINRGLTLGRQLGAITESLAELRERMPEGPRQVQAPETAADRLLDVLAARMDEIGGLGA
jgi:hypothetical protein